MNNVSRIDDSPADALMGEIVDDFLERLGRNETPDIEDYVQRYPNLATVLRQMLPTLQLVHGPGAGQRLATLLPADALDPGAIDPEGPLGDYRLVREIGRGGMGVVYEAVQISLGRRVALKVLPFAAALDSRQLQRFKNEAQAAAHLHHQNIVPVYGVGCERAVHFYAMQFIEGQSLAEVLAELRQEPGRQGMEGDDSASHLSHAARDFLSGKVPEDGATGARQVLDSAAFSGPEWCQGNGCVQWIKLNSRRHGTFEVR